MTDLALLHAAILAEPGEDTPRLAYADALDERNEPGDADRAAFIRIQCGRPRRDGDRPEHLWLEAQRMLARYGAEWRKCPCPACGGSGKAKGPLKSVRLDQIAADPSGPGSAVKCDACKGTGDVGALANANCEFRRGFVARIDAPLAAVMKRKYYLAAAGTDKPWEPTDRARAWIAAHPVEEVWLTDRVPRERPAAVDFVQMWFWYDGRGTGISGLSGSAHHIPAAVWDLLEGGQRRASHPHCMYYPTADAAHAALARAVAKWLCSFR